MGYVGKRVKRTEDPRLIKGLAHYVDDIRLPDTLHVAFVRSVYAHARLNNIDASEALKAPGVVAAYTGKDVAGIGPVPCAGALPDLKVPDYRVLAQDKVYFVGHPIAAVVATDRYAARDAVDLVVVDYEDLPVVTDVEAAAAGGTIIHESFPDNIAYKLTAGEGDIEAALNSADHVISQRMLHQRLAPIAMEPRGVLARYFPGEEELTLWSSTQIPHILRTRHYSRSRRGFWLEAKCLCGRSATRLDFDAVGETREVDRNSARKYSSDHSRPRPGGNYRDRM
jgi:carbon-monoxide dehydrogenase large subunit